MRIWIQLTTVALALAAAFVPIAGGTIERQFSTTLYPGIQRVVTSVSNVAPFALFDLLIVSAAVLMVVVVIRAVRAARRERRIRPIADAIGGIATTAALVYLVFLGVWGLNYRRLPMAERLVIGDVMPDTQAVVSLGLDVAERLNALHAGAHRIGWSVEPRDNHHLLDAYARVQQQLTDAPPAVPGRLKPTVFGPYFRWTGVDGMVNPFALEVLANPDLLPFERPFVAAHEWAHLAGYANESEASFVGWLTCVQADVPAQYSAWLFLYWQMSGELPASDRTPLWEALADGPRRDLEAIAERLRRGQLPLLRRASWAVYDGYLRANRVDEGVRSYGEVISLILRARFEEGWNPVRRK